MRVRLKFWLFFLLLPLSANAAEVQYGGYAAIDARAFPQSAEYAGQKNGTGPSIVLEPEFYHVSENEHHTVTARPFARYDMHDDRRTHVDIRQLDWLYTPGNYEIRAGVGRVFWGVVESRHLVNIINQDDAIEDTDGEDKLGQPMVAVAFFQDYGTLRFFYLPYFRERTFPGKEGRLRSGAVVDTDHPIYESGKEEFHQDVAARFTKVIDNVDLGVSYFRGTSREPRIMLVNNGGNIVARPFYEIINQFGLDTQYTSDGWLWKLEAIHRDGRDDKFFAASGGFEYTLYQIFESDADLGLLLEYHYDGRDMNDSPAVFTEDDIFMGARYVVNDIDDTEILAGALVDRDDAETFINLEASTRVSDDWKLEFDARLNTNIDATDAEAFLRRDDFLQLRLAKHF
ncbi:MAG: hypothetical protein COV36_01985 [Alphaproteobacteria bacterium CG11_big_fil_rev_8_21_14_0_20_44_7]|nr:MAG: hypothetical protein COV36_01985 [Alphaproteobacteria bacterium CG11_big_fil_rev_8_21_14_0_20_44_7]